MNCRIEVCEECPGHFQLAQIEAWEKSLGRWRLEYGYDMASQSHIAAYFGFVPLGVGSVWAWADVLQKFPNRTMLRIGQEAWRLFMAERPWTIYARCEGQAEKRFAEWLGFKHIGFQGSEYVMRRD